MPATARYLLFLLVFTLISFEIILRVYKVNATWAERNSLKYNSYYGQKFNTWFHTWPCNSTFEQKSAEYSYVYTINSLGLREKENVFADSLQTKIICLGDSYTEGMGAPYDSSYPRFLEKILIDSGFNCRVYNAGMSGSDPFYEYMLYREKLIAFHPQYLLLQINQSDITDYIYRGGLERFKPNGQTVFNKGPWYKLLYKWFYTVRFLCNTWPGHLQNDMFITQKEFIQSYSPKAIEAIGQVADTLQKLTIKNNCKLLVILQPIAGDIVYKNEANTFTENEFEILQQHLEKDSILNINLWPALSKKINAANKDQLSWAKDSHYNSAGYYLFASALLDDIGYKYPGFWR